MHFHDLSEHKYCLLVFLAAGIYGTADLWHFSVKCILAAARCGAPITDGTVFGISSIPTFLFIPVKGKPSVQMGAMQKEDFEGLIDKIKIK